MSERSGVQAPVLAIPAAVLSALPGGPVKDAWVVEPLAAGRPVFRVRSGGQSFIVKQSDAPDRVVAVAKVFALLNVPLLEVTRLEGDWLCLGDLALPTLEQRLTGGVSAAELAEWMPGLGAVAAQADLVAMRDRNLRNVMVTGAGAMIHIDYEAAFSAGIVDRLLRPKRYAHYLVRRLFFDVVTASRSGGEREPALSDRFTDGWLREARRLAQAFSSKAFETKLSWIQRLYLRTAMPDTPHTQRMLRRVIEDERHRRGIAAEHHP